MKNILLVLLLLFFIGASHATAAVLVQEDLLIPDTQQISVVSFRILIDYGAYDVPLVPKNDNERVIVPNAILTLKGAYSATLEAAKSWAPDAKLAGIRSIGSITLDGKSSMWQVAYGSYIKKSGYEIIIKADSIVSQKEIPWVGSGDYGYSIPINWYDAADAFISISSNPQYKDTTVSAINFYYNEDGNNWSYALATSNGITSMPVRGPLVYDTTDYWSVLKDTPNSWNFRKTPGVQYKSSDDIIKIVPNDWAIKVTSTTDTNGAGVDLDDYRWYQVEDVTDGTRGWMAAKDLASGIEYLSYDVSAQTDLEQKASVQLTTKAARVPVLLSAVDAYHTQSNALNSLYGGGGGLDGRNDFQKFIQGSAFPKELVLAIASVESGNVGFDNEIVTFDYGHGIMQSTFQASTTNALVNKWDNRGLGSSLVIPLCKSVFSDEYKKCYAKSETKNTLLKPYKHFDDNLANPVYKQYTNTYQSIYANIKDGYRVLQEKYRPKCPAADRVIGGLTFTCQDVGKILTVWGYNGKVLAGNYLKLVSNALRDLSSYVGVTYANTDQLVEKLALANDNRIEFKKFSPVEIQVIDAAGRITGFDGTSDTKGDIPFSAYDQSTGAGVLFFPEAESQYKFRVIGTGDGTYDFEVDSIEGDNVGKFRADSIPVTVGVIHEFTIDEAALELGEKGVTVRVDSDGDGVFDYTTAGGREINDIEPPQITITPLASQYLLNSNAFVEFSATDQTSGVASVTATLNGNAVISGQAVTAAKPGVNILVVTAVDNAGNSNTATSTFSVVYSASNFLPPVEISGSGIYNRGRTLPVAFELKDLNGNPASAAVAHLVLAKISEGIVGSDEIPLSSSTADLGNVFRNISPGRYLYNLNTDTMTVGSWQIKAVLDSGQNITAVISIK